MLVRVVSWIKKFKLEKFKGTGKYSSFLNLNMLVKLWNSECVSNGYDLIWSAKSCDKLKFGPGVNTFKRFAS